MQISSLAIAAAVLLGSTAASAVVVYDLSPSITGNQNYSDNLGLDFTVVSAITVNRLGAFDSGSNGISTNVTVGIWNLDTQAYVTPLVNFNGRTASGGSAYAFKSIGPVTLTPGNYSIIGFGFNSTDPNYNTNMSNLQLNSPISFNPLGGALVNGVSRFGGGTNPSAGTIFPFASAFAGGTFGVVPEPANWALLIAGFGLTGAAMRRRRSAALTA